jgi:RNA polymerase-binding transcription factor DksA
MNDIAARERLENERERLGALIQNLTEDNDVEVVDGSTNGELSAVDKHPGDMGSDTFEREKDMVILGTLEDQVTEVELALKRIEAGTYGACEACGKPIGDERLEVVPTARYCVEDQGARETQ